MQEFATKSDNVGDTLGASGFNAFITELENICKDLGFTLDPEGGPDTDFDMLGKALAMMGSGAEYYADSGSANTYVLSRVGNMQSVRAYFDGMRVTFQAGNTNTGASTINVDSLGSKAIVRADGTALSGGEISALDYTRAIYRSSADRVVELLDEIFSGAVVQESNTQVTAVNTGTTTIPHDNTIPQNTEGDEYMTLAHTPKNVANILTIKVGIQLEHVGANSFAIAALFQDSTANALKAVAQGNTVNAGQENFLTFEHRMVAGTISPTTFKVRAGKNIAGTMTFNGSSGTILFGGVAGSFITITETTP